MLPLGTTRNAYEVVLPARTGILPSLKCRQDYEEVTVPPASVVPPRKSERLIPVAELDPLAKGSFPVRPQLFADLTAADYGMVSCRDTPN